MNEWLLSEVLRGEWGYTGTLITDWDNVGRMVWEQRVQPDLTHAAAATVKAGNDMVMTTPGFFEGALDAVARGMLTEADLDRAVGRILTLKFDFGLFENPRLPDPERIRTRVGAPEHTALNLEVARRSLVLLRNDGLLPLTPGAVDATGRAVGDGTPRTVAVFGPLADDAQAQLGDWAGNSGQGGWMPDGHRREMIRTVRDGLEAAVPAGWTVSYERGADILALHPDPLGPVFPDGQPRPPIVVAAPVDDAQLAEVAATAAAADVAVVVVGDTVELTGEGRSTATLELLGGQIALLDAVVATGTPTIVVLLASKPLVLPPSVDRAAALLWAANPGMQGGTAIAELLLGLIEPSGRLPISFARHVGQQPTYYNQIRGQHGDRYADLTQAPAFAFGEGLTYTDVAYEVLSLDGEVYGIDDTVRATVSVRNRGERPAHEVVQLYVRDVVTSVSWTDRELKAFRRVVVPPGETVEVAFELPVAACTIVDADGRRIVEAGDFEILVGPSSREEQLLAAPFVVRG